MPLSRDYLKGLIAATPRLWRRFTQPPPKDWRVMIVDPDGCPAGTIFLLDIQQVSRLVGHLRRLTGQEPE